MIAISADDAETLRKFRASLKSTDAFVADAQGKLMAQYGVKLPLLKLASRATFVIGPGRKVLRVDTGSGAIDPEGAVRACPLRKPGSPDAGK